MTATWQRKRTPDEVPTPIAVALSDFCRRAGSPSTPQEVREALSVLSDADDFRIQAIADREPEEKPLGPWAVVDMALGAEAELAKRRQVSGYYALAQALCEERLRTTPPPTVIERTVTLPPPAPPGAPTPSLTAAARAKKAKDDAPTMKEKIAPKKRAASTGDGEDAEPNTEENELPGAGPEEAFPKRKLPEPRGKFVRVGATKSKADELFRPEGKEIFEGLLEQHPHRIALTRVLAETYNGRAGSVLTSADVTAAMEVHGLLPRLERNERELLLGAFTEHRGASGRVAWALGASPAELDKLTQSSGLQREVDEIRERFRREALSPKSLGYRLDLLGRTKYLDDLGIKKRFLEQLAQDVRQLMRPSVEGAANLDAAVEDAGRRHGVAPELLSRAIDKLKLGEELKRRLSPSSHPSAT